MPEQMKDTCDFPAFTAHCLEGNILHIDMKKINELTAKDVEQIYECHQKIGNGKKVYAFVTFQGYIPLSDEAMAAAKKNKMEVIHAASAYVVSNFALRIGVSFFMNFHKPKYPTHICGTKAEAISWLKQEKLKGQKVLA